MKDIQLKYKRETGKSHIPYSIEAEPMVEPYNAHVMSKLSKRDILLYMVGDKGHFSVKLENIPNEFVSDDCYLDLVSPEYVEWLEEQLENRV